MVLLALLRPATLGSALARLLLLACLIALAAGPAWSADNKSGVAPTVLSLPSGPGSIEGLGESFQPQLNTGTANYRVPLRLPPGRAGFAPQLALSYNSGDGQSPFGLGWKLDLPFIQRQTDKGLPLYTLWPDSNGVDHVLYAGGEELVPIAQNVWRLENDTEFVKAERIGAGWVVHRRDGVTLTFGSTTAEQVQNTGRVFRWDLSQMTDLNGNVITFQYEKLGGGAQNYMTRILYNGTDPTAAMVVDFAYAVRPDIITDYRPGFELKTTYRCSSMTVRVANVPARSYQLAYAAVSDDQPMSLLASVTQVGRDGTSTLPPATFTYSSFDRNAGAARYVSTPASFDFADPYTDLFDVNGDGLPDALDTHTDPNTYYLNRGPDTNGDPLWAGAASMGNSVTYALNVPSTRLADMNADGRSDLLHVTPGDITFFTVDAAFDWQPAPSMGASSGFTFDNPAVQLVDANNDKYIDVVRLNGGGYIDVFINLKGTGWSSPYSAPSPGPSLSFMSTATKQADMNGDRLQDLVFVQSGNVHYYPSMGYGLYGDRVDFLAAPDPLPDPARVLLVDVNGDGRSDLVYMGSSVTVWLNKGLNAADHSKAEFAAPFALSSNLVSGSAAFRQADVNGNGSADVLWNTSYFGAAGLAYIDFAPADQPYQLKTITNGIGQITTLAYRSSVADLVRDRDTPLAWSTKPPFPVPVIASITVSDGLQQYVSNFTYRNGYYDGAEKQFRGFASATRRDVGDASIPDLVTAFDFDTGFDLATGVTNEARKGKLLAQETRTPTGALFFREEHTWDTKILANGVVGDPRKITFARERAKSRSVTELGQGTLVVLSWAYDYDDFGNRTSMLEQGRLDGSWDDERLTVSSFSAGYPSGQGAWILDRLVEQTVSDENGNQAAATRNFYDQSTTPGQVSNGNLTRVENWVSGGQWQVSTRNDFDAYGNIVATYDGMFGSAAGHSRQFTYDPVFHTFPVQEVIQTGSTALSMSATYDPGFGVMTCSTDFNGYSTCYGYDTFARLTSVVRPGDSTGSPTTAYDYVLNASIGGGRTINWVETRQRESAGGGTVDSRSFFDGLSRKVMTRAEGETAGQTVVSDTVQFNGKGMARRKYLPYFEGGGLNYVAPSFSGSFTEHLYDAMGREIRMTQPDGSFATTEYQPLKRIVRDEEQTNPASIHAGGSMQYVTDGLLDKDGAGRLREVREPAGWTTRYTYDVLDNLKGYTDAQSNQKFISFDGLSRKTFMNDPDRGQWSYAYDNADNLIQTTDAKGQVIRYQYDGANRILNEFYGPVGSPADVQYHYDAPAGPVSRGDYWLADGPQAIAQAVLTGQNADVAFDRNGDGVIDAADVVKAARTTTSPTVQAGNTLGKLAWVKDQSGEEHTSYDARGRVVWTVKRIKDDAGILKNFFTGMDYDSMDRVTQLTYPDQTTLAHQYNGRGLPEAMTGVVTQLDYNPAGERLTLALANGVTTSYQYDLRLRLQNLRSVRASDSVALQDFAYGYDGVSNITRITDQRSNQVLDTIGTELGIASADARKFNGTQDFAYDSVYRLTQAKNDAVWGRLDWQYDAIGNMTRQDAALLAPDPLMQLGAIAHGGSAGSAGRIGRSPGAPAGPHAITGTGNPSLTSIAYDPNGNAITENGATLSWDPKDRLTGYQKESIDARYAYDFRNVRVLKHGPGLGAVFYVDKYSEQRDGTLSKYAYAGSGRVGRSNQRNTNFQPATYYVHNHLGSTQVSTSEAGAVVEGASYYPFGSTRHSSTSIVEIYRNAYGFVGKERDSESQLEYFGARYLHPGVAAFISADLASTSIDENVREAVDPQILGPYAYGRNNPIAYVDPDGNWALPIALAVVGYVLTSSHLGCSGGPCDADNATSGQKADNVAEGASIVLEGVSELVKASPQGKVAIAVVKSLIKHAAKPAEKAVIRTAVATTKTVLQSTRPMQVIDRALVKAVDKDVTKSVQKGVSKGFDKGANSAAESLFTNSFTQLAPDAKDLAPKEPTDSSPELKSLP